MRFVQSDLCCRLALTRLPLSQEMERNGRVRKNEVTSGRRQAAVVAERGDLLVFKVFHTRRQQRGNRARPNSQDDTKGCDVFYIPQLSFFTSAQPVPAALWTWLEPAGQGRMQPRGTRSAEGTFCYSTGFLAVTQGNLFLKSAKRRNGGEVFERGSGVGGRNPAPFWILA